MKEQEIKNRINILEQQLFIVTDYRNQFNSIYGKNGTDKLVDKILDELIFLNKELKNNNYE
ncbi:MAG: hypothetical protein AB8H03_09400 [Saprospiraceae bacterium]